jgi:DNA-binding NtrC family response regulator
MKPKILVVDDGDRHVELAHRFLRDYAYATRCDLPGPCWSCERRAGCALTHAHDVAEVDEALRRHPDVDVVLLDVAFDLPAERLAPSDEPDLERRRRLQGLDILGYLRRTRGAALPVVLMTSREELAYQQAAGALDADEWVTLAGPDAFDARALGLLIERVLARRAAAPEGQGDAWRWGRTLAMARLRRDAEVLARTSLPVLLYGETGTGKSALAERVIHAASRRRGPFVALDLAALPPSLVASELFGTARGSFSGAVDRAGHFERAHGGTLFLDEVGNLPPDAQRLLLVALESGRVTRLGEVAPRPAEVKLVAATNADLPAAVRAGTFRADLHARLNPAAALTLPPLRARLGDLEELMGAFARRAFAAGADRSLLASYLEAAGLDGPVEAGLAVGRAAAAAPAGVTFVVAPATLAALRAHRWPGNLRELERLVVTACAFALSDAARAIEEGRPAPAGRALPLPAKLLRELIGVASSAVEAAGPAPARSLHEVARSLERELYRRLFAEERGDFEAMARRLLTGDATRNARRVRLRFNQLGLSARSKS